LKKKYLPSKLDEEGEPKVEGACPVLAARAAVLAAPLWGCLGSEFA
jgi:hypothetical protein